MSALAGRNIVLAAGVWAAIMVAGCVTGGYDSHDRTTTTTDPKTGQVIVVRDKGRSARYTDSRQAGQEAAKFVEDNGGLGGIIASISTGGWAGIGTGLLGLIGISTKAAHSLGTAKGKDLGWDERERAAAVQNPLPPKPEQT